MIKRLCALGILGLITFIGCVPKQIETFAATVDVEVKGKLNNNDNAVTDTLLDDVVRLMGMGATYFDAGGLSYFWFYHKYKYTSDVVPDYKTKWEQIANTHDVAGGGDTAAFLTMSGEYEYDPILGLSDPYDSIFKQEWTWGGMFTDSATAWYCYQHDTVVLVEDGIVTFNWTLTATALTADIQDDLLYHVIYGLQTGVCAPIDSMKFFWRSGDTNAIQITSKSYDFTNDSTIFVGIDTARSTDTLNKVQLIDDGGLIMYRHTFNGALSDGATPKVRIAIGVVEH